VDFTGLAQYGLAGIGLFAMGIVIVYQNKVIVTERKEKDDIQEQRLQEARETQDKLTGPLEKQGQATDKIYDLLLQILDNRPRSR
jgi:DNA-binding transcriptional regulator YhcF (GntR family)